MKAPASLLFCSVLILTGCGLIRSSYHVVTAPVRMVHHPKDKSGQSTTTTASTGSSDVNAPGRPLPSPTPIPPKRTSSGNLAKASPSPSQPGRKPAGTTTAKASQGAAAEFPTAKAVPGKPGYVYDPFNPNGGYIDVSGYASGSKVKDPVTKKIFVVP